AQRRDVSDARRHGADRAECLGEGSAADDDHLHGDLGVRPALPVLPLLLLLGVTGLAAGEEAGARGADEQAGREACERREHGRGHRGALAGAVRVNTCSAALAFHAAATSSMYWPRMSRALRCASSTLGSAACPSR